MLHIADRETGTPYASTEAQPEGNNKALPG
jgi:hypothetical protein